MKYNNPNICLSLGYVKYETAVANVKESVLCEIRFDLLNFSDDEYAALFRLGKNIIATCRSQDYGEIEHRLWFSIEQGCFAIDIDVDLPSSIKDHLTSLAKSKGCKIILSYHNFESTPRMTKLKNIYNSILKSNPDFVKIATMGHTRTDLANVLALYQHPKSPIAFVMGEVGKTTRLMAPILGAPFTYASMAGFETAPGQLNYETVDQFLRNYSFDL